MTVIPLDVRKTAIDRLPRANTPQGSQLNSAISALPRHGDDHVPTPQDVLEKSARDLVGQTFFGTLLKQMRDSPFKSDLFSGGRGEQAFAPMYDSIMASRLTQGAGQKLVTQIVRKFQKAADAAYKKKEGSLVSTNRRA
ncbi:MAG: rod-binding protein [Burkholderiales bacterium]|nr:rod-binding protein [Phycisphaerae bacterium]